MSIWVASVPSSVFIYAGVLEAPKDVRWYNVCATHMGILWVAPPSLLGHSETFYEVKISQGNIFKRTNTTALNYTFLRPGPSGAVYAAWNPVGKGVNGTDYEDLPSELRNDLVTSNRSTSLSEFIDLIIQS